MSDIRVIHGDCRDVLKTLPDNSVDSIATDPPYALVSIVKRFGGKNAAPAKSDGATGVYGRAAAGFMGETWDNGDVVHDVAFWAECWRVLKPGGHLIAFSATRTQHRQTCAIEDAGFEIRDMLAWLYGSGFPKSHDVSKGIDRANGDERPIVGKRKKLQSYGANEVFGSGPDKGGVQLLSSAASAASAAWEGWGTALKPALEPICLARKPLDGTVAANVLAHGTGALNIAATRVDGAAAAYGNPKVTEGWNLHKRPHDWKPSDDGRWPANVVHDGSAEVAEAFPDSAGQQGDVRGTEPSKPTNGIYGDFAGRPAQAKRGDSGSAARFFYSAKADADDRLGSKHPTVKPIDLMAWLVRLVTPPGGVVLDPFAGSGSTGMACLREGFDAILIERDPGFHADILRKVAWARGEGRLTVLEVAHSKLDETKAAGLDLPLFSEDAA